MNVLVDFSNLVWTCFHASLTGLSDEELARIGEHWQDWDDHLRILEIKLGTIEDVTMTAQSSFVMVKDQRAVDKYALFPAYKGERKQHPFDPRPSAEKWVRKTLGCTFAYSLGNEADDAIATLAVAATDPVVVVTGDRDLWQLLGPNVRIYDIPSKQFVTPERIVKAFGVEDPAHIKLVKSLWGDVSDNIPNAVPRMQKSLLPLIKQSNGKLPNFWGLAQTSVLSPRCRKLMEDGLQQVCTNYQLVKLKTDCAIVLE